MLKRSVFIISDSTGITAQTLTQSILSQFDETDIEFDIHIIPYVDSVDKALSTNKRINDCYVLENVKPIIFDTVINPELSQILAKANGVRFDVLGMYLKPLQKELGITSNFKVGMSHGNADDKDYLHRIDAVNFAMDNDDGAKTCYYDQADLILIGVSRCGKTPTCLYLALQFGIFAANYPITEDDIDGLVIPQALKKHKHKLFGLTISAERLSLIRNGRRANSRYASLRQCETEIREVEAIYRRYGINFLNTTHTSIEEIAATILDTIGLKRV